MKSLQLQVALLPNLIVSDPSPISGSVVVDTLRFTTTAAKALSADCRSIHVAGTIPQAFSLASDIRDQLPALLCGERHCRPIAGFDLGNSPDEYTLQTVKDRRLIFTTTNGTVAVQAARRFPHCLLGSLVNRTAIARRILELKTRHCLLICSGTDGEVAGEDMLTAGAIIAKLVELTSDNADLVNDSAILALQLWNTVSSQNGQLLECLSKFSGGQNLIDAGFAKDVAFACQLDSLQVVPTRTDGHDIFVA